MRWASAIALAKVLVMILVLFFALCAIYSGAQHGRARCNCSRAQTRSGTPMQVSTLLLLHSSHAQLRPSHLHAQTAQIDIHTWIATTSSVVLQLSTALRRHTNLCGWQQKQKRPQRMRFGSTWRSTTSAGCADRTPAQQSTRSRQRFRRERRLFVLTGTRKSQKIALLLEMVATIASSVARLGVLWALWPARVWWLLWARWPLH